MKKILLTGASGFLGSRFYDFYKDEYEIIPLTSKDLDVTNENDVINTIKKHTPDYTINTAGITSTAVCDKQPEKAYNVNVKGNINIAKGCKITGSKMIYLSTEQVYNGHIKPGPYSEDNISNPVTEYGRQKLEGEKKVREVLDDNLWILRFSWLYGLPEKGKSIGSNIVWNVVEAILKGKNIELPVNEYRGMTYVYDVIKNITKVFDIPYGTYNFGSSNNLNTYETGKLVLALMQNNNSIINKDMLKYCDATRDLRMDPEKITSLGIYFDSTEKSIERCLNEFGL